jgi:hypothetical protein
MYLACARTVAYILRFGCDSQAHTNTSVGMDRLERLGWAGTSWKGLAGQGPAISYETGTRPIGFSYVYKYQLAAQVE